MGYEVQFFINGRVAVYCTSSDRLCPIQFQTLQHLQSYCGFLEKKCGDEDPRDQRHYAEWHNTCVANDDLENNPSVEECGLNELGKSYIDSKIGEFSFKYLLGDAAKTYLTEKYGYFNDQKD